MSRLVLCMFTIITMVAAGGIISAVHAPVAQAASSNSTNIVVRTRTMAPPSSVNGSVSANIGTDYTNTVGAVFTLSTDAGNEPGESTPYSCTVNDDGECTITVPNTNSGGSNNTTFWVMEKTAPAGTYSNPMLKVGNVSGPAYPRYIAGRTQKLKKNATQYMPMTASGVQGGTVATTDDLPGIPITNLGNPRQNNAVAQGGSFGAVINSLDNPSITPKCGSGTDAARIALVLDESLSISDSQWQTYRSAIVGSSNTSKDGLFGTLASTSAQVSILGFHDTAFWYNSAPLSVKDNRTALAASLPLSIKNHQGSTNWDDALRTIARSSTKYDLVLFITDGAPNNILSTGVAPDSANVTPRSLEAAVYSANAIKSKGTRIVSVGVGAGITPASPLGLFVANSSDGELPNPSKDYCLYETKAPAGYVLGHGQTITIRPGDSITPHLVYFMDEQQKHPNLPLTGATGAVVMTLGGIALVAAGGVAYVISRKRSDR